jgi:hypothetical protein
MEAWLESFRLLSDRANILIRPHPRVHFEQLQSFTSQNIRLSQEPTAELIPLCDLYVASISATIRWAIACGIPVINYDTYRYRYDDYDEAPGVVRTEGLVDFRAQLTRFVDDASFANCLAQKQQGAMRHWGLVDDEVSRRLASLVREVTSADPREGQPDLP